MTNVDLIIKVIGVWIIVVIVSLAIVYRPNDNYTFFRLGYHDDLEIFGMKINTMNSYLVVVLYTIINTIIRALQQEILLSWITNNVRDEKADKNEYVMKWGYKASMINTTYIWFDFYMYMNILMTQIDLFMFEMIGHIITTYYTTNMYLVSYRNQ